MQKRLLSGLRHILHLYLLIITMLFIFTSYHTVFALSPSFPVQGIILHADNWQLDPDNPTTNISECKQGHLSYKCLMD
jgi:hypothetical protein